MALLEDYASTESKTEVLQALKDRGGIMDARALIESIHTSHHINREEIRRAILRLTADGRTAYTSDWQVRLLG